MAVSSPLDVNTHMAVWPRGFVPKSEPESKLFIVIEKNARHL